MLGVLAANPVLTVFLVIAFGSLFGLIPFGPIRFGPAGALFVGLALSVIDPRLGVRPPPSSSAAPQPSPRETCARSE